MDYYKKFKQVVDDRCGELFKKVSSLKKQLDKLTKRLENEKDVTERLTGRIKKLKDVQTESFTGDKDSYEKAKVLLKNRRSDLVTAKEVVQTLEKDVIPKVRGQLDHNKQNLKISLQQILIESRGICDAKINELLIAVINERQAFLDDFTKLFADFGQALIVSDESICPGPWNAQEISDMRIRLGIGDVPFIPQVSAVGQPESKADEEKDSKNTDDTSDVPICHLRQSFQGKSRQGDKSKCGLEDYMFISSTDDVQKVTCPDCKVLVELDAKAAEADAETVTEASQ